MRRPGLGPAELVVLVRSSQALGLGTGHTRDSIERRPKAMKILHSSSVWERYLRWNQAIADVVFGRDNAGKPVYLDLEDDVLDDIARLAEPDTADAVTALVEAVRNTLTLRHGAADVFTGQLRQLNAWRKGDMWEPPPVLGLLALLSLSAETMHEGGGMRPHNFYGRLAEHLDLDDRSLRVFQSGYRRKISGTAVSALLWRALNEWLETLEGNRGLPTAYALGHEHIGLPVSQALVRQTDRERFADLFAANSLPPRSSLPPFEMEELIEEWISQKPCPASYSLERLWRSSADARGRITDVAVMALESWDGISTLMSTPQDDSRPLDIIRASAVLRKFPTRSIEVGLVVPSRTAEAAENVEVLGASDAVVGSLELVPASTAYLGLADAEAIDGASFLAGEALLRRPGHASPLRRRSRRAVPMRYDEFLHAWVECERIQLGEEALILIRDEIASSAMELLTEIARPGFRIETSLSGLPDGWTLFSGVQVLSSIPTERRKSTAVDLNVLQAMASAQLVLEGGLRIPGNISKWSTSLPPEIRATSDSDGRLEARLVCSRELFSPRPRDRDFVGAEAVLVWDLAQEGLGDGDYELSLLQGGEPVRTLTLRLRSADNPAVGDDDDQQPIAHDADDPGFGLVACRGVGAHSFRGVIVTAAEIESRTPPSIPGWYSARKEGRVEDVSSRGRILFPAPHDSSCMATGSHLMSIETARPGLKTVEGICKHCGLVKRYPAFRGKRKSSRQSGAPSVSAPRIDVTALAPVREAGGIDWESAFDAVCHIGSGPASALTRVAAALEGSGLFGDVFERRLESLGHIEIERAGTSLAASSWGVVDPVIVGLSDGSATIAGFRSEAMMTALEEYVRDCQGSCGIEPVEAPPVVEIAGLTTAELNELAAVVGRVTRRRAQFVPRAAENLAAILPPLSNARRHLPSTSTTSARGYERWDPQKARFEPCDNASSPSAFRLSGFRRTYIYRTTEDLASMSATVGDARIVKYLAAADADRPLVGYDSAANVLYVPLGADLPGLYGRAATLCSGRPPVENLDERILEYRNVPPHVAAHLSHLLMS